MFFWGFVRAQLTLFCHVHRYLCSSRSRACAYLQRVGFCFDWSMAIVYFSRHLSAQMGGCGCVYEWIRQCGDIVVCICLLLILSVRC
ncbi:hypothetical protein BDZ94DRAFT_1267007 [Collybia nuda]|uniref:Uncharacterized protein n=1 Tax=Collybia nuda TaxID=64659 RepID=A0A9P6CF74_9AGAR|nr:hypothetical protein BDZ94DRAFT_1267007 [Collybia nuda]